MFNLAVVLVTFNANAVIAQLRRVLMYPMLMDSNNSCQIMTPSWRSGAASVGSISTVT